MYNEKLKITQLESAKKKDHKRGRKLRHWKKMREENRDQWNYEEGLDNEVLNLYDDDDDVYDEEDENYLNEVDPQDYRYI